MIKGSLFCIKFASRNLLRNRRRTFISILGLSLSMTFIVWALSFSNSADVEVINEISRQLVGKWQISRSDYNKSLNPSKSFYWKEKKDVVTRIQVKSFISGRFKTAGVLIVGIDPTDEKSKTRFLNAIVEGRPPQRGEQKEIILGHSLLKQIGAKLNDEVALFSQGADGSVANDLFKIVGILNFGGGDLERKVAFSEISSVRDFASVPAEKIHQVIGFTDDFKLKSSKQKYSLELRSWKKTMPDVAQALEFIKVATWLITIIIIVIVSLGMMNTLLVSFTEREKEFRNLNIIGCSSKWISASLFWEGIGLVLLALLAGNILSIIVIYACSVTPMNLELFTGGQPIFMGGMVIHPLVKLSFELRYFLYGNLMVATAVFISIVFPIWKIVRRTCHVN